MSLDIFWMNFDTFFFTTVRWFTGLRKQLLTMFPGFCGYKTSPNNHYHVWQQVWCAAAEIMHLVFPQTAAEYYSWTFPLCSHLLKRTLFTSCGFSIYDILWGLHRLTSGKSCSKLMHQMAAPFFCIYLNNYRIRKGKLTILHTSFTFCLSFWLIKKQKRN